MKTVSNAFPIVLASFLFFHPCLAFADDPKAREIMQKVEDRDDGDNMTGEMEMILIDKKGRERIRKIFTFMKNRGEDTHRLMFFTHPPDVKDTAFLTYDYDDQEKDDDQWLYLPALKKTKRIATDDKSGSFMGSDLNYSDMTSRDLDDFDFFLEKETDVRGNRAWVIRSIPKTKDVVKETGYEKSLLIVRQDIFFVVRAVHWVSGGYLKYVDAKNIEQIDGIWFATETEITKKKGKKSVHGTVLKHRNVKFGQNLDHDMFSVRRMEKGL